MIAKVLRGGSGFSGVIEYLYEGKLENRKADDKKAEVILHSDNLRVPRDWQDVAGRAMMKADFIEQAQAHRLHKTRNKDLIGEHVLSFTPDDVRKLRTREGMRQVASEYVKLLGLDKTQHVVILHQDTNNPHLHILFNRVTNDLKKFNDSWEKKRAVGAGVALAQKYDLHLVGGLNKEAQEPRAKTMRAGMADLKALQAQQDVFGQARNLHHLGKLAAKQGLEIEQTGDKLKVGGKQYKLSDMEAMFQANRNDAAAKKAAAKASKLPIPVQETKQEGLRAQERQELFKSLGMGHFAAKARRMGIEVTKEPEHFSFNGERYLTKDVEVHLARNFEQSVETRRETARRLAKEPTLENASATSQNEQTVHPLVCDATSMEDLERRANHRGVEFNLSEQHIRLNGTQYPLPAVEVMMAENARKAATFRAENGLAETQGVGRAPENRADEEPLSIETRRETAMPKDPETAAYLEGYGVKSVALQTATSLDNLEKLCREEGAFFAVGEYFTKVGDHSLRNEWIEAIMAENVERQKNWPIQRQNQEETMQQDVSANLEQQESPVQIAARLSLLEAELNAKMSELMSARNQLAELEAQALEPEAITEEKTTEIPVEVPTPIFQTPDDDLETLRQFGEDDLLSAQSMDHFVSKAELLEWPVTQDERSVTVNGQAYPKDELEDVFTANREEFHDSLRQLEPLLDQAHSLEDLERRAKDANVTYQAEDGPLADVHLNGERYALETVIEILTRNTERATQEQTAAFDNRPETQELFRAQSMAQFVGASKEQGLAVEVTGDSVNVGGARYAKKELEDVFSANAEESLVNIRLREPLLQQARSMMELKQAARDAGVSFGVSNSDRDREVVRLRGITYEKHDIDTILTRNAAPNALAGTRDKSLDNPDLLLRGRGTSCNSLHHLGLLADKMDIGIRMDEKTIQTKDLKAGGQTLTFDRKEVEAILTANQAARLTEIRQQLPVLDKAQSLREFEDLAQKEKVGYRTVQLTEYELEMRRGKEAVRVGKAAQEKGKEQIGDGRKQHREGQAAVRQGRRDQTTAEAESRLGNTRLASLSKPVREARLVVKEGQTAAAAGLALIGQGKTQKQQGVALVAEGMQIMANAQAKKKATEKASKTGEPLPETQKEAEKKPTLLERIKDTAGQVGQLGQLGQKEPKVDYKINKETRLIVAHGANREMNLQRGDLRAIFEENKTRSLNEAYEQRRGNRILQESTSMGDFHRRTKMLGIPLEDKGRTLGMGGHEYQKSDLRQLFRLNAQNPANVQVREYDHRQTAGQKPEAGKESQKQSGSILGAIPEARGAQKGKKADSIKASPLPRQTRRRGQVGKKKKKPDYLQKLARQEEQQSRSQSHSL